MTQIASLAHNACPKDVHSQERRNAIAAQIEALADQMNTLVAVLDEMDADPDFEPTLGSIGYLPWDSQVSWADGIPGDHEREEENEHGGDILDDAHL